MMIVWLFYSILFVAVAAFWIIFGAGSQLSMHVVVLLCRRQLFPMFFLQIAHCYKHKSKMFISKKKKNQQIFHHFMTCYWRILNVQKSYYILHMYTLVLKRGLEHCVNSCGLEARFVRKNGELFSTKLSPHTCYCNLPEINTYRELTEPMSNPVFFKIVSLFMNFHSHSRPFVFKESLCILQTKLWYLIKFMFPFMIPKSSSSNDFIFSKTYRSNRALNFKASTTNA